MKAYVFPGQGSQFPGMAKDLYERSARAHELLEQANDILGFRITDIMFEGTAEDLKATKVTQPAVFLHSVVSAVCAMEEGVEQEDGSILKYGAPDMVAGHSLGEFSALAVSGALDFADALRLVSIRAAAMQECCEAVPGKMAAIIALPTEEVEEICNEINAATGTLVAANYNCDGQIVISGTAEAVAEACTRMKEAGAKRALELAVSGAFHSPLMAPAGEKLAKAIQGTAFHTPSCPVYQNVTALATTDPQTIKENILKQLTSPVRWTQTVRNMAADAAAAEKGTQILEFTEFGPGDVLKGLVKKTIGTTSLPAKAMEAPSVSGFQELDSFAVAPVDTVCWKASFPYKPAVTARIGHNAERLFIRFDVEEENAKAVTMDNNGPVWEDSCVEFFVKVPGERFYFNFETNCIGVGLAAKRVSRSECTHFSPELMEKVVRRPSLEKKPVDITGGCSWSLELEVPFELLGCDGCPDELLVNFYKCGDKTAVPHFLSWSPVCNPTPDFHLPQFFGKLKLI